MLQTLTFNFSPAKSSSLAGTLRSDGKALFSGPNLRRLSVRCAVAEASPATAIATETIASGSLYEVLRVNKDASSREIKTAYRTLAKIYHPDTVASAAARLEESSSDGRLFIEIHNAYATLSDPAARALYDLELSVGARKIRNGIRTCSAGFHPTRRWETDQCW